MRGGAKSSSEVDVSFEVRSGKKQKISTLRRAANKKKSRRISPSDVSRGKLDPLFAISGIPTLTCDNSILSTSNHFSSPITSLTLLLKFSTLSPSTNAEVHICG